MGLTAADGISLIEVIMWHSCREKMCFYGDLGQEIHLHTPTHAFTHTKCPTGVIKRCNGDGEGEGIYSTI